MLTSAWWHTLSANVNMLMFSRGLRLSSVCLHANNLWLAVVVTHNSLNTAAWPVALSFKLWCFSVPLDSVLKSWWMMMNSYTAGRFNVSTQFQGNLSNIWLNISLIATNVNLMAPEWLKKRGDNRCVWLSLMKPGVLPTGNWIQTCCHNPTPMNALFWLHTSLRAP